MTGVAVGKLPARALAGFASRKLSSGRAGDVPMGRRKSRSLQGAMDYHELQHFGHLLGLQGHRDGSAARLVCGCPLVEKHCSPLCSLPLTARGGACSSVPTGGVRTLLLPLICCSGAFPLCLLERAAPVLLRRCNAEQELKGLEGASRVILRPVSRIKIWFGSSHCSDKGQNAVFFPCNTITSLMMHSLG